MRLHTKPSSAFVVFVVLVQAVMSRHSVILRLQRRF